MAPASVTTVLPSVLASGGLMAAMTGGLYEKYCAADCCPETVTYTGMSGPWLLGATQVMSWCDWPSPTGVHTCAPGAVSVPLKVTVALRPKLRPLSVTVLPPSDGPLAGTRKLMLGGS